MSGPGGWLMAKQDILTDVPRSFAFVPDRLTLYWQPERGELGMRFHEIPAGADVPDLANLDVLAVGNSLEVSTSDESLFGPLYALVENVAEQVHEGHGPLESLNLCLELWRALSRAGPRMSIEEEVGLFGELCFLRHLIAHGSGERALNAWVDGTTDFRLESCAVEMKTSRGSARIHEITSGEQLATTSDPIFFASMLIDDAGAGGGQTLAALAEEVATKLGSPNLVLKYRSHLIERGLHPDHEGQSWLVKGELEIAPVDGTFPLVSSTAVKASMGAPGARLRSLSYSIDATGLGWEQSDPRFGELLTSGGLK